ncbi:hypothetical protein [Mycobacterium sp. 1245805.9]|uniref:hypothetical protein n=1 Tax=Mycobacterium sp. 1245805.9 TaxID=1856862 RepID=UPI000800D61C|nr:hypothetical protein [Mycobacterium sp. 1245805.9]OBI81020.1 hypothetical protein A9X00_10030 [Mycobacterium sp. 1245805.9]
MLGDGPDAPRGHGGHGRRQPIPARGGHPTETLSSAAARRDHADHGGHAAGVVAFVRESPQVTAG